LGMAQLLAVGDEHEIKVRLEPQEWFTLVVQTDLSAQDCFTNY
jgi:hypothetical protein